MKMSSYDSHKYQHYRHYQHHISYWLHLDFILFLLITDYNWECICAAVLCECSVTSNYIADCKQHQRTPVFNSIQHRFVYLWDWLLRFIFSCSTDSEVPSVQCCSNSSHNTLVLLLKPFIKLQLSTRIGFQFQIRKSKIFMLSIPSFVYYFFISCFLHRNVHFYLDSRNYWLSYWTTSIITDFWVDYWGRLWIQS